MVATVLAVVVEVVYYKLNAKLPTSRPLKSSLANVW